MMATTQTQSELWTVGQAAQFLKMSTSWVYQAAATGRLPAVVRIGRAVRFDASALRRWVDSQVTTSPATVVHLPKKG